MNDHAIATELLDAHLATVVSDFSAWLALFTDDAVIEFPYARRLGSAVRLEGKPAITAHFQAMAGVFSGMRFDALVVEPLRDPGKVMAQVHATAHIAATGKTYDQRYVMLLEAQDGRIVRYTEYWDPLEVLEAFGGPERMAAILGGAS